MFNLTFYFLIYFLSFSLSKVNCQDIPPIAPGCSHLFQYLFQNGIFVGRLTLADIQIGWNTLEVYFSQQSELESGNMGSIFLRPDEETINNIKDSIPMLTYHIDFPMNSVVPKLTKIEVNNKVLCAANEYKPPSTSFKMQHTVRITTESFDVPKSVEIKSAEYLPESEPPAAKELRYHSQIRPIILSKNSLQSSKRSFLKNNCGQGSTASNDSESIVKYGEYPWLAAIHKKEANKIFISGGTLISSRTIVTSAHNFVRNDLMAVNILAYLGQYNLADTLENVIQRDIKTLLIHPEYKSGYYFSDADIALLQLLAPVGFDQYVRPICIWNDDVDESIAGKSGIIAGWDIVNEQKTSLMVPKKLKATVISDEECSTEYAFDALRTSRTLCVATNIGTGPCGGGDGLMFNRDGRWVLRAIVSAGLAKGKNCDFNQNVIYCDIGKHKSWIWSYMLP